MNVLEQGGEVQYVTLVGIEVEDLVTAVGQREQEKPVRARAAGHRVVVGAAEQEVRALAAVEAVVACATVEQIVALEAEQLVVAAATRDRIKVDRPQERLGTSRRRSQASRR